MLRGLIAFIVAGFVALTGTSGMAAAPTGLSTTQVCSGNSANVTFQWRSVNPASRAVWIDLTTNNHWRPGTYMSAGPLPSSTTSYLWLGIKANEQHFYRVAEQQASGEWSYSVTSSFTAVCGPSGTTGATMEEQSYRNRATAQLYALTTRLAQRSRGGTNPTAGSVLNDFVAALNGLEPVPPRFRDVHYQLRDTVLETLDCFNAPLSVCDDAEFSDLLDEVDDALEDYELVVGIDLPQSR